MIRSAAVTAAVLLGVLLCAAPIDARAGKGGGFAIPFLPIGPPAAPAYASATLVASRPQIVSTQTIMAVAAQPQVVAAAPQVIMQQPAMVAPQMVLQQQPAVVAAQPTVVAAAPAAPTVQYMPTPVPTPYAVPVPVRYSTVRQIEIKPGHIFGALAKVFGGQDSSSGEATTSFPARKYVNVPVPVPTPVPTPVPVPSAAMPAPATPGTVQPLAAAAAAAGPMPAGGASTVIAAQPTVAAATGVPDGAPVVPTFTRTEVSSVDNTLNKANKIVGQTYTIVTVGADGARYSGPTTTVSAAGGTQLVQVPLPAQTAPVAAAAVPVAAAAAPVAATSAPGLAATTVPTGANGITSSAVASSTDGQPAVASASSVSGAGQRPVGMASATGNGQTITARSP